MYKAMFLMDHIPNTKEFTTNAYHVIKQAMCTETDKICYMCSAALQLLHLPKRQTDQLS